MSIDEYVYARGLAIQDPPFYGLIMAAMRRADSDNAMRLRVLFPETSDELRRRSESPGGLLPDDPDGAFAHMSEVTKTDVDELRVSVIERCPPAAPVLPKGLAARAAVLMGESPESPGSQRLMHPLEIDCPDCKAGRGSPCRSVGGERAPTIHLGRHAIVADPTCTPHTMAGPRAASS